MGSTKVEIILEGAFQTVELTVGAIYCNLIAK